MALNSQNARAVAHGVEDGMSDKIYEIPAEWAKRAFIDGGRIQENVRNARSPIPTAFGPSRPSASTG